MDETGIRTIVLAHNRDDLAETFLMRLIRGAGGEGLACMSGRDEHTGFTVYRPLLKAGRIGEKAGQVILGTWDREWKREQPDEKELERQRRLWCSRMGGNICLLRRWRCCRIRWCPTQTGQSSCLA